KANTHCGACSQPEAESNRESKNNAEAHTKANSETNANRQSGSDAFAKEISCGQGVTEADSSHQTNAGKDRERSHRYRAGEKRNREGFSAERGFNGKRIQENNR